MRSDLETPEPLSDGDLSLDLGAAPAIASRARPAMSGAAIISGIAHDRPQPRKKPITSFRTAAARTT
ncbi:hypothetical protein WME73_43005 [Sorangium sp. So ce302]|uniref:hypothetical protein n=1 Tax=Sorangium sp. So ce302 TaxID=3133297 RepID=UPI003F5FED1B